MALLRSLALFLLCLVGYSAAAVGGSRRDWPRPAAWELLLTAGIGLLAAIRAPGMVGHWLAFPTAVVFGAVAGGAAALVRSCRAPVSSADEKRVEPSHRGPSGEDATDVGTVRSFLLRLGEFQARITMGYLYFLLLAPFAAVSRLLRDPLAAETDAGSYWRDRTDERPDDGGEPLTRQY